MQSQARALSRRRRERSETVPKPFDIRRRCERGYSSPHLKKRQVLIGTIYDSQSFLGGIPARRLLQETEDMLYEGIELSKLPKTFQDAITVTRRFGISYLWIDCLCVLQDSQEDLNIELRSMHKIYANSYLNISADWGGDSSAGLFHARDPDVDFWAPSPKLHAKVFNDLIRRKEHSSPSSESSSPKASPDSSSTENHSKTCVLVHTDYWDANMHSAHINSRGWVLQERYLSPRVLHFSQKQLLWECRRSQLSEMYPSGLHFKFVPGRLALRSLLSRSIPGQLRYASDKPNSKAFWHNAWCDIVEVYSRTDLSFPQDELTALSGVAKYFAIKLQMHDKYLAGLWQQDLRVQLLWSTNASRSGFQVQRTRRVSPYRAPSWSWAAVDGSIKYWAVSRGWRRSSQCCITVLDTQLVQPSGDCTGPTTGGYLELRGTLGKAMIVSTDTMANPRIHIQRLSQGDEKAQGVLHSNGVEFDSNFYVRLHAPDDDFPEGLEDQRAINFLVVNVNLPPEVSWRLRSLYILLLVPVPEEMGSFRRVGMSSAYLHGSSSPSNIEDILELMRQGNVDIPCRDYKDGLHTIWLV